MQTPRDCKQEMDQERPHIEISFIKDLLPNELIVVESNEMNGAEAAIGHLALRGEPEP